MDGIMHIWLCIRSHFHLEKEKEGKVFSLSSSQDSCKHLPKHQMEVMIKFWKPTLSTSPMKYVVDRLNNNFTVSGHFVLADKLSFTGREFFAFFPILMMKVKYEIKQFLQYCICMFVK